MQSVATVNEGVGTVSLFEAGKNKAVPIYAIKVLKLFVP